MPFTLKIRWRTYVILAIAFSLLIAFSSTILRPTLFIHASSLQASGNVTQLSTDPYTNGTSQHHTEVEPASYSNGSTIVSAFQAGRFASDGSSNFGWATSNDGGHSWHHGFLPGTTTYVGGHYSRLNNPSVTYDSSHTTWIISSIAISNSGSGVAVIASLSKDGNTWSNPVTVKSAPSGSSYDKDWVTCDNTSNSPYYGHCYAVWNDSGHHELIMLSTTTDGGKTWGAARSTSNNASGLGGQPVVQHNGNVIVTINNATETSLLAFTSNNGGGSWSNAITVASIQAHPEAGNFRSRHFPSAQIDGSGKVYVVLQDCRFENNCSANDLVMVTSNDGKSWSGLQRIPIDPVGSGVDHFIPGLGIDKSTSGGGAHLGLTFYYYPVSNCSSSCQLEVGYASSNNGGQSWSTRTQIAGPMNLSWLPTSGGYMVGGYITTSISGGRAYPFFALAHAPNGGHFDEAMYTVAGGLSV